MTVTGYLADIWKTLAILIARKTQDASMHFYPSAASQCVCADENCSAKEEPDHTAQCESAM